MQTQKYLIYQLVDPVTYKPFYVGSTKKYLSERLAIHVWYAANRPNTPVAKYIRSLSDRPYIDLLESNDGITRAEALVREQYWIDEIRNQGFILVNKNKPTRAIKI